MDPKVLEKEKLNIEIRANKRFKRTRERPSMKSENSEVSEGLCRAA